MKYYANINGKTGEERKSVSRVTLTQHKERKFLKDVTIRGPESVTEILNELEKLGYRDREVMITLFLNTKNQIEGYELSSMGTLSASLVHPREILKGAILNNANSIILAHNHPSGNPNPSAEDIETTHRINDICNLLGIKLLDHVIIAEDKHISLQRERVI